MRYTLNSWKPSRWSALSGMALLSQVSVNYSAAEFEKSLMMWARRSSSVLLRREWTFARWMLGIVVREPCLRNLTSASAYFPLLHLYACLNSTTVPPTRMSNKMSELSENWKILSGMCCLMLSSPLVKLIEEEWQNTEQTNKRGIGKLSVVAVICGAILMLMVINNIFANIVEYTQNSHFNSSLITYQLNLEPVIFFLTVM